MKSEPVEEKSMNNYIILFSSHKEWGKIEVQADSIVEALELAYGNKLPEIKINTREDGTNVFYWEGDNCTEELFTGVVIKEVHSNITLYMHDYYSFENFSNRYKCIKYIIDNSEEADYDDIYNIMQFLSGDVKGIDCINVNISHLGDITIF